MPIYACENCNYTAKKKQLIKRHLNKKNPCSNQVIIINKSNMDLLEDMEELKIILDQDKAIEYYKNELIKENEKQKYMDEE